MMLRKIMLLVSGTGSLLLLLAILSTLAVQARSQELTQDVEDLSLVNQIGGGVVATAKQGNYLYAGMGPRLLVMDVQDPTQPVVLGQTEVLSGVVSRIQVAGDYAYLGVGDGLSVVDVSEPDGPMQVGFFDTPGSISGVTISDTLAYIAEAAVWDGSQYLGGGLRILDISDPVSPAQVGYLNINASSYGVSVLGNFAYLNNNSGAVGFMVVDVSDPAMPNQVNFVNTFYGPGGSAVSEGHLYITMGAGGVEIYNLADPQNPAGVGYYDTPGDATSVYINNDRAYIADTASMIILDVSSPTTPNFLGNYNTPEFAVFHISADGNYAYVANRHGGLRLVNVANATMPVEVGAYDLFGDPYGIEVENGYAYMLDYQEGLHVLNLINGTSPTVVGFHGPLFANDFEATDDYVYLVDDSNLIILDVTDPASPTQTIQHPVPGPARDVAVDGNHAYIAAYSNGLQVVDISNPQTPMNIGALGLPSNVGHVATTNGFAYAADRFGNNVYIIDVNTPMTPTLLATYPLTSSAYGLDVVGNYVYVAQNGLGLHVIDVTIPTTPTMAGHYPLGWGADNGDIQVVNGRAYLAAFTNGVAMFDVSDPTDPVLVDVYDSFGLAQDVALSEQNVYVTDGVGGLLILDNGVVELPTLSVENASLLEGDEGTAVLTFTVTLNNSEPVTQVVTVEYATADGTAVAHQDYHPISGTLTFTPGETVQTISVLVVSDTAVETNETFYLNLSNPINAILLREQAIGTILNDDMEPDYPLYLPVVIKP